MPIDPTEPLQFFPTKYTQWNEEMISVFDWLVGSDNGVDIACGRRSPFSTTYRVDSDPRVKPDCVASADALPLGDETVDWVWCSHGLEHFPDPLAAIREARRIVRPEGRLVYIVPDKRYTAGLDSTHVNEWMPEEFVEQIIRPVQKASWAADLQLVAFGVAAKKWSFHAVWLRQPEAKTPDRKAEQEIIDKGLIALRPRDLRTQPIRICTIGDHPRLTTGLGTVHRMLARGFQQALMDVRTLGCMETTYGRMGEFPWHIEPVCPHDFFGYERAPGFILQHQPEALFIIQDPGGMAQMVEIIARLGRLPPLVVYFPIEGTPIHPSYLDLVKRVLKTGGKPITYTQWGANEIREASGGELEIGWVWHGVDHAPFAPIPSADRERLRRLVNWHDRFVVMNVSRNKRTNRHPVYIEAAKILREKGYDHVLFYLHCQPFEGYNLQGWDLHWYAQQAGVAGFTGDEAPKNMVVFPPDISDQLHGIAYQRPQALQLQSMQPSNDPQMRGLMFAQLSLIERYNMADMYLDASSVQGFNLPNVEAMACGVPVFATADGVRREVLGDAAYLIEPDGVDYWHTGSRLYLVSAARIAEVVMWACDHPDELSKMRQASLERAKLFRWKVAQTKFIDAVREVVNV